MRARIQAFTIIELVITMLLVVTVTGLAYGGYQLLSSVLRTYDVKNNRLAEVTHLTMWMERDVQAGKWVVLAGDTLKCISANSTANYILQTDKVIRLANIPDTFRVSASIRGLRFPPLSMPDTAQLPLTSSFDLIILLGKDTFLFVFKKKYSSFDLINFYRYARN